MYKKPVNTVQSSMFSTFIDVIDQHHPSVLLTEKIDWQLLEDHFSGNTVSVWVNRPHPLKTTI